MQNNFYRFIFTLAALFFLSGESRVQLNLTPCVTQTITISGDAIYIGVNIVNNSTDSIFLEKVSPVRERTLGPDFTITSNGNELAFIGAMAKRKPYQRSDFFELKSGESERLNIRIDLDYQFLPGKNNYEVSYIYIIYNPSTEKIVSNNSSSASFEYSRNF